jgi:hypothetical protein
MMQNDLIWITFVFLINFIRTRQKGHGLFSLSSGCSGLELRTPGHQTLMLVVGWERTTSRTDWRQLVQNCSARLSSKNKEKTNGGGKSK